MPNKIEWNTCPLCQTILVSVWRHTNRATCPNIKYGEVDHYIVSLEANDIVEFLYLQKLDIWYDQHQVSIHKPGDLYSRDLRFKISREVFVELLKTPEDDLLEKARKLINFQ